MMIDIIDLNRGEKMNKDKILEVAQKHMKDERQLEISAKSSIISMVIMIVLISILLIWRLSYGENIADYGLILITQVIAFSIYQYVKMPERKLYLGIIVVGLIMFITVLVVFLASYGVL